MQPESIKTQNNTRLGSKLVKTHDNFEPKKVYFDFARPLKKFWCHTPNKTYFFNALAVLFPSFERLFILSVLSFRKRVKNSPLEKSVRSFLIQEAQHDKQVGGFMWALEQKHGYHFKKIEASNLRFCKALNRKCSASFQLAMTMGAEHLISLLSDFYLREPKWLQDADLEAAALWRWHAIEEIEHKSVAYDVFYAVDGRYWVKACAMIVVTSVIFGMWLRIWLHMLRFDKTGRKIHFWVDFFNWTFVKPGVLRKLMIPMARYFLPNFHPWQHDNTKLIEKWKQFFAKKLSNHEALQVLKQYF